MGGDESWTLRPALSPPSCNAAAAAAVIPSFVPLFSRFKGERWQNPEPGQLGSWWTDWTIRLLLGRQSTREHFMVTFVAPAASQRGRATPLHVLSPTQCRRLLGWQPSRERDELAVALRLLLSTAADQRHPGWRPSITGPRSQGTKASESARVKRPSANRLPLKKAESTFVAVMTNLYKESITVKVLLSRVVAQEQHCLCHLLWTLQVEFYTQFSVSDNQRSGESQHQANTLPSC